LRPEYVQRYPHAFSGGERQRIGIARALSVDPKLVIADEAVSALDVSVQAQILNLLKDLQDELDLTFVFIAHNLSVVRHFCDRVLVMYLGRVVEVATARAIFAVPRHPYTEALLNAAPVASVTAGRRRPVLKGEIPDPAHPPSGCAFHGRCPYQDSDRCVREVPPLRTTPDGRLVACHYADKLILSGSDATSPCGSVVPARATSARNDSEIERTQ
jgi:peptide/nickel transport system ATP-binding protein